MTAAFLMRLSAGITLMWVLMPRRDVTDGFFRIQMRVVLGVSVLTALMLAAGGDAVAGDSAAGAAEATALLWLQIATAVVTYGGSICWALGRRGAGSGAVMLASLLCGLSLLVSEITGGGESGVLLRVASGVASAGVLGAVLTAMLLGHWYLTSPTMTLRPLRWFSAALAIAAGLRLVASVAAVVAERTAFTETTHWIWLSLRFAGGIAAPAVAALLVFLVLRYRNTQSATGVLFACLILVFMGEMSAALLERELGIPC